MNPNKLLDRLDKVRQTGSGKWVACCPAHEDKTPSLQVTQISDRVLIHCFAGCGANDVLDSVGLEFSDICPDNPGYNKPTYVKQEDEIFISVYMSKRRNGDIPSDEEREKYKRLVMR